MLDLSAFHRFPLTHAPTPLERLARVEDHLRGQGHTVPRLWVKRDDATGLALGGNKVRKLEFLVGDAQQQGADALVTVGATQSNHVRQTAAAAAKAGMACYLVLEDRIVRDEDYARSGNVLLDEMLGATVVKHVPSGTDLASEMSEVADALRRDGATPYVIPGGGSTPLGALGYAVAAQEILSVLEPDVVVHATGSMGTQAGFLAGFRALGSDTRVVGVSVRPTAEQLAAPLAALAAAASELLGSSRDFTDDIEVDDRWVGPGYGVPTPEMVSAVQLLARREGVLLDPVYAGKAFAGLLGQIAEGRYRQDEDVVFVHTGGTASLFAYRSTFADA